MSEEKTVEGRKLPIRLLVGVAIVGVFVVLVLSSLGETMVYYKTVDELLSGTAEAMADPVRVSGVLVPQTLKNQPGTDRFRFEIRKGGRDLSVAYKGVLPDGMEEGRDIVVHGVYEAPAEIFRAEEIMAKCPSKYENQAANYDPAKTAESKR